MFWLRKFLSPLGIVLILTCLAFPFVGVSGVLIEVEISGWDMAASGEPSVSPPDSFTEEQRSEEATEESIPAQPLMIMFVLSLLVAAMLGITLGSALARALTRLTAMGFATITLVANQVAVTEKIVDQLAESSSRQARQQAAELVDTQVGYWLTLTLTIAVFGLNIAELVLSRRRHGMPRSLSMPAMPMRMPLSMPLPPGGYLTGSPWTSPWAQHHWHTAPPNTGRDVYP